LGGDVSSYGRSAAPSKTKSVLKWTSVASMSAAARASVRTAHALAASAFNGSCWASSTFV